MKKLAAILPFLLFSLLLSSCVRTGEKDSLDFLSAMIKAGYDCAVEETQSGEELKESCYINGCKLSLYSNEQGKLIRVSVTYAADDNEQFLDTARQSVYAFCSFSQQETDAVFDALGIGSALPADSSGVARCETEWYYFSFTCDKVGGTLVIDSLRLNPTSAPTVTLNTTVPFVKSDLSEKSSF